MSAIRLKNAGRYKVRPPAQPAEISATNIKTVLETMDREANVAVPIRPQGAGTATNGCNESDSGTVLRLSGLDRFIKVDAINHAVTAQAGVRLYALSEALAENDLEGPVRRHFHVGGFEVVALRRFPRLRDARRLHAETQVIDGSALSVKAVLVVSAHRRALIVVVTQLVVDGLALIRLVGPPPDNVQVQRSL